MLDTCKLIGVTPLTEDEFAAEDKRILTDFVRRRHGIHDSLGGLGLQDAKPINYGVYR